MRRSRMPWNREYEMKITCDRCGATYRDGELIAQDGLMVCKLRCYDAPSYEDNKEQAGR